MPDAPYREGLDAVRRAFEAARDKARARASSLAGVPDALRKELAELDAALDRPLETVEAVTKAEALLVRYESALAAALLIAEAERVYRRRRRVLWIGAAVVIPVVAAMMVPGLLERHQLFTAHCREGCDEDGRCHARSLAWLYGRRYFDRGDDCVASDETDCATPCRVWGRCHLVHNACRAETDEDCRNSERCRELGECHVLRSGNANWGGTQGTCAIRTREDCAQSLACLEHGRCRVGDDACER